MLNRNENFAQASPGRLPSRVSKRNGFRLHWRDSAVGPKAWGITWQRRSRRLVWLIAVGLLNCTGQRVEADDKQPLAGTEPPRPTVAAEAPEKLVQQLGASTFVERERASEQLVQVGLPAIPAVKKGLGNPDPEIRFRCERILSLIEEYDFERRLEAFAAGKLEAKDAGLPGWERHRKLLGEGVESRKFFVEIVREEAELLRAMSESKEGAPAVVLARMQQIQRGLQSTRLVPHTFVAAMLSLMADSDTPIDDGIGSQAMNFCNMPGVTTAFEAGERKEMYRKLFALCLARGGGQNTRYIGLQVAMRLNMPEGLMAAEELAKSDFAGGNPWIRQMGILAIGKLGSEKQVPILEELLNDKSVCHQDRQQVNGRAVMYTTQICDCALAVLIHLKKLNHKDFGMNRISQNPQFLFTFGTMGYEKEEDRRAGQKKWADLRAVEKARIGNPAEKKQEATGASLNSKSDEAIRQANEVAGKAAIAAAEKAAREAAKAALPPK